MDTFDIQVKGGNLLPPLGPAVLAVHALRDTHQGLSADAKKLADRILKRLSQDRANLPSRSTLGEGAGFAPGIRKGLNVKTFIRGRTERTCGSAKSAIDLNRDS